MATQPWQPPSGDTWNNVDILFRTGLGREITIPEGDQNNGDFQNAINWLGNRVMEILDTVNFQTGDLKPSFNTSIPAGWLLCDYRTIGSPSSNSTLTGNEYYNLFKVIWVFATNSDLLTSAGGATTKGVSSDSDWLANKRIYLPDLRGRTLAMSGKGNALPTTFTLGQYFGTEGYSDSHDHNVNIVSASALGDYTPTGTVAVAPYVGNITPTGTVTVDEATLLYEPTPVITVDPYVGNITPTGTVNVTLTNNPITGTVVVNSTVEASGSNIDLVNVACVPVNETEPTESVISCSEPLPAVSSTAIAAQLSVDNSVEVGLSSDVTVNTATFTGNAVSIGHSHTASITGLDADLSHTHTATFTGNAVSIGHTHTATFTGATTSLAHTHIVSGQTAVTILQIGIIQPTIYVNYLIRL